MPFAVRPAIKESRSRASSLGWLRNTTSNRHVVHACVLGMAVGVLAFGALSRPSQSASTLPRMFGAPVAAPHAIVARAIPSTQPSITLAALHFDAPTTPVVPLPPQKPAPELKSYAVQNGDNPFNLAQTFGISEETLLAANGLGGDTVLQIGQKLLVPSVNGLVVTTQPGDTITGIANQWKISLAKLVSINKLDPALPGLIPGEALLLPGVTPPVQIYPLATDNGGSTGVATDSSGNTGVATAAAAPARQVAAPIDLRPAVQRSSGNNFPWGQCTYWAAQARPDIGSRVIGNAASWLYSARASGLPTGTVPRVGSVVVYQPGVQGAAWVGHVAYVTSVAPSGRSFTVSEMNFPYWGHVTYRTSYTGWGVNFIY
ncbi:MAG: LysM peptidoglycan-binding domain-containing protein [Chloroflexota bacterium]